MKKAISRTLLASLLVIALLLCAVPSALAAGDTLATVFPDANFRAYVKKTVLGNSSIADSASYSTYASTIENYNPMLDSSGDLIDLSKISSSPQMAELKLRGIDVSGKSISSLKGIEKFTNLMALDCTDNSITSLDLSDNILLMYVNCASNKLTSLVTPDNAPSELASSTGYANMLVFLNCKANQLTSLAVNKNTALSYLNCSSNLITSLDLSKCSGLTALGCANNKLSSISFSSSVKLKAFACENNALSALNAGFDSQATNKSIVPGSQSITASASNGAVSLSGLAKANVSNLTGASTTDYKSFKLNLGVSSFSYDYKVGPSTMKVTVKVSGGSTVTLPADITGDGKVNSADLTQLLNNYGKTGANAADITGDGKVNSADLTLLLNNYGKTL